MRTKAASHGRPIKSHYFLSCTVGVRMYISCDQTVMWNGLSRTYLPYSGDVLRSFNVQPTSQVRRYVGKRLFSIRICSQRYKYVNKGNSNCKQSFNHSVTVRNSEPGVTS